MAFVKRKRCQNYGLYPGVDKFFAEKSGLYKRCHRDILSNIKFTTAAA